MAILVNAGKQWIVDKMRSVNGTPIGNAVIMEFIHWGINTGDVAEAVGQTALTTPSAEARVAGTVSSPSANVYRVVGTLTSASTQTIKEAGVFSASTAGTMLIRAVFTGIPLVSGDQIQFTFDLTVA